MRGALLSAVVCASLWGLMGCATDGDKKPPAAEKWDVVLEKLKPNIPDHFKEGFRSRDAKTGTYLIEYVPEGEEVTDWTEIITVQYFPRTDVTAEEFYRTIGNIMKHACDDFSMDKPITGTRTAEEMEYTIVRGATYCGTNKQKGRGEFTNYSIVRGITGIHVLQRAVGTASFKAAQVPLTQAQAEQWIEFFNKSLICVQPGQTDKARCATI